MKQKICNLFNVAKYRRKCNSLENKCETLEKELAETNKKYIASLTINDETNKSVKKLSKSLDKLKIRVSDLEMSKNNGAFKNK